MALKPQQRKQLRQIGHQLHPIVTLGQDGLTDNVIAELMRALDDHELIKVKIAGEDRVARQQLIQDMVSATQAESVQEIGKVVVLYKKSLQPNLKLSNVVRFSHLTSL